ncbi:MAG TPA: hypothetical protein PKW35_13110 [Nannocystaceae bacterium]|nr:hypothetical protein [Nannocystaceae bacterium]
MPRAPRLALALALVGCQGPAAKPAADATPAPAAAPSAAPAAPARKPVEPLTQEELDLIAADPATLTPDLRRKRAFALRKKIMQNPDSPAARQLEAIREGVERGEIVPQLPRASTDVPLGHPASTIPEPAPPAPATPEPTPPATEPTPKPAEAR